METPRTPTQEVQRVLEEELAPRLHAWFSACPPHLVRGLSKELLLGYARPYAVTLAWVGRLFGQDALSFFRTVARRALTKEGQPDASPDAVDRISQELPVLLRELVSSLDLFHLSPASLYFPPEEEGMFWLDARVARFLSAKGAPALAEVIRTQAKTRWETYLAARGAATPKGAALLLEALWSLFANRELEREGLPPLAVLVLLGRVLVAQGRGGEARLLQKSAPEPAPPSKAKTPAKAETKPHGTVATLHLEVIKTCARVYAPKEAALSPDRSQVLRDGEVIARVATLPKRDLLLLSQGMKSVGKLTFRRAVNYLVRTCWERHQAGEATPGVLQFQGPRHFAECIGEHSHESFTDVLTVLLQGQHFTLSWPGGFIGGLWTFEYQRACRGRTSLLEVQLARLLRPHYGMGVLDSPWRVPVVPLGPFVGRNNDHAAQAAFQERFLIALTERHVDLYKHGGALLREEERRRLASEVGLPKEVLPPLLARWTRSEEDGLAFLERDGDRFTLADNETYRLPRAFLLEAGRRSVESKAAAKRGILEKQRHRKPTTPK